MFRLEKLGRRSEIGLRRSFVVEELDEDDDSEGIVMASLALLLVFVVGDRGILSG